MFKIGIIGSDNSHAEIFAKLCNLKDDDTQEYAFPDCRVVGIYGHDKNRTEEVAKNAQIEFIAAEPKDLLGRVDAVMVVFRHGDLHKDYALPFIEAGIPTWIDKPFTIKNNDAKDILEAAKKHKTLVTGGSTCKYAYDVLIAKNVVENESQIGKVKTAVINFTTNFENEYGGIYFYGAHLVEMALEIFGYDVKSVTSSKSKDCVTAILKYSDYQVTLNFVENLMDYNLMIIGEKGTLIREIDISNVYKLGFEKFAHMLRTKNQPYDLENIYSSVKIFNSLVESYNKNICIQVPEI